MFLNAQTDQSYPDCGFTFQVEWCPRFLYQKTLYILLRSCRIAQIDYF